MSNTSSLGYVYNPDLPVIKPNWKGNPIIEDRFINHEHPVLHGFKEIRKWKSMKNPDLEEKKQDTFRLETHFIDKPFDKKGNGFYWLGHATFLFKIGGKMLITDPIFGSPTFFMKRYVGLPVNTSSLIGLDYVLLSHDHRDHLDKSSLKKVFKQNPDSQVLTGLNIAKLVRPWTKRNRIMEAGWFQQYDLDKDITVTFLPTRHWGKRWLNDTNLRLWGSFMIQSKDTTIFWGGDSGYGSHYEEISELFPEIDYAFIGIGAYKPEWFMHPSHTSPNDAVKAARDLKARYFIPMHYGTFDLSDEAIGDPHRKISRLKESSPGPEIIIPAVGEYIGF